MSITLGARRASSSDRLGSAMTALASSSLSMNARRSRGWVGSSSKYAPPAFITASDASTDSTDRPKQTATMVSIVTPSPISRFASWFERRSRSPYVKTQSPQTMAGGVGGGGGGGGGKA